MTRDLDADHRPWPLPQRPWVMKQTWDRLLFAHWPVRPDELRDLIPRELTLDTFDGAAWVAVVPFGMSGIRLRGLPPIPGTAAFPEINVRTYVAHQGKPGVYFFSLDATNPVAVASARRFFRLPYVRADISVDSTAEGVVHYRSRRTHRNAAPAEFVAWYAPVSEPFRAAAGSLERWLTERYALYTVRRGDVYRGDIHHDPWPLQLAQADIRTNTMAAAAGIALSDAPPLLHYAHKLDVLLWTLEKTLEKG
ncbi:YqjF family protein [Paenibacillus antri]